MRPGAALLHPAGTASLRQHVLPLNRALDHFGQYAITGPDRFDVTVVLVDGKPATSTPVEDHFAPGDFENLSATDQISRDSFEEMDAGVRLDAPTTPAPAGTVKVASVDYETKIVDTHWRSRPLPRFSLDRGVQLAVAGLGAPATGGTGLRSRFARTTPRPPGVALPPERYTVATTDTLTPRTDIAAGLTKGAAISALRHTAAVRGTGLQVVPDHELRSTG